MTSLPPALADLRIEVTNIECIDNAMGTSEEIAIKFDKLTEIYFDSSKFDKADEKCKRKEILQSIVTIMPKVPEVNREALIFRCLEVIQHHSDDRQFTYGEGGAVDSTVQHQEALNDVTVALNAVRAVFSVPDVDLSGNVYDRLDGAIFDSLWHVDDQICGKIAGRILPSILSKSPKGQRNRLISKIWPNVYEMFVKCGQKSFRAKGVHPLSERPLMLLCLLADWLFPVDDVMSLETPVVTQPEFWTIVQSGFFHFNPITRKRSLYLLKRILDTVQQHGKPFTCLIQSAPENSGVNKSEPLFWWSPEHASDLSAVWENFILLIESVAEKQVHMIRPLMPRLQSLLEATKPRTDGPSLLHSSWVGCLAQRVASHENSHVKSWGITEVLTMEFSYHTLLVHDFLGFLCGSFVIMLTEPVIYYKKPEDPPGSISPSGESLVNFFRGVCGALDQANARQFLHRFIYGVASEIWSSAALVYLTRALAHLPTLPLIGVSTLPLLKDLVTICHRTMQPQFRGAIQCFLMQSMMNLLDLSEVTPQALFPALVVWRSDESLCRGTSLWNDLIAWYKSISASEKQWSPEVVNEYLRSGFSNLSSAEDPVAYIRLLLLASDSEVLDDPLKNQHAICRHLQPITELLTNAHNRAYVSTETVAKAIRYILTLLEECQTIADNKDDLVSMECQKVASGCVDGILLFVLRHLTQETLALENMEHLELYREFIGVAWSRGLMHKLIFSPTAPKLLTSCTKLLRRNRDNNDEDSKMKSYGAMLLLGAFSECVVTIEYKQRPVELYNVIYEFFRYNWDIVVDFARPSCDMEEFQWGKVSSQFLGAQWRNFYLIITSAETSSPQSTEECVPYMEKCIESLDLISGEALTPILDCMTVLLGKVTPDMALSALEISWRMVKEDTRFLQFWDVYHSFLRLAYQPISMLQPKGSRFNQFLLKCGTEINELGEERSGIMNSLIKHLCELGLSNPEYMTYMTNVSEILVSALIFGPIHSRGKRFYNEVVCFISGLGEKCSVNLLHDAFKKDDRMVRVMALSLLMRLNPKVKEHNEFAQSFLSHVMKHQCQLVEEANYKNFPNALPHRLKHRGITAVLVLMPFVDDTNLDNVVEFAIDMMSEEPQPSVRLLVEWIVITLLLKYPQHRRHLWENLKRGSDRKAACLCSLHSVVMHLSGLIPDPKEKEEYMLAALPCVLPWSMVYHFNTRTFATACLIKLWRECKCSGLTAVMQQHAIIDSVTEFHEQNSNNYICKTTQKLLNNFFYVLHPVEDFSVQTIFHTLPRLTLLVDEEWLPADLFSLVYPTWSHDTELANHTLPLYNVSSELENCEPGTWKVKNLALDDDHFVPTGEVQKKIIPWRSMMPDSFDLDDDIDLSKTGSRSETGGLILVTSLIDKPTNLGGLCRTCEIFGVSDYVIGSMKFVNDRNFDALSVSAHKWLPITEVPVRMLREYMLQKQEEGYTLVGAEQTTNSVCLTQYKFPKKTLLLLGNEKEGIPVDLIQLLDVCVEIPQRGIIRSLNVHVSGALLIWEYTRQHITS